MNETTKPCTDETTGALLPRYELGLLSPAEQIRFEKHLLDCDACCRELSSSRSLTVALRDQREALSARLKGAGLTYEGEMEALASGPGHNKPKTVSISSLIHRWQDLLRRRRLEQILIPAAVAAIILLVVLRPFPSGQRGDYLALLQFDKAYYDPGPYRSPISRAEESFQTGMKYYADNRFPLAILHLQQAVKAQPEAGAWWMYLGVCYYLNRQAKPAIQALTQAESLTAGPLQERTRWYMAQAYLLKGNGRKGTEILQQLATQPGTYSARADSLLIQIRTLHH